MHFEDHIADNAEDVLAATRLHGRPTFENVEQMFNNTELVVRCLGMLGFEPKAELPWQSLGIPWEEGPIPELIQIETRIRLVTQLLRMATNTATTTEVKHIYCTLITDFQDAGANCIQQLPALTNNRRRKTKDVLPRVREVEGAFLHYLRDHCVDGQAASIQLQLSDLQEIPLNQMAASPLLARQWHECMHKTPQNAHELAKEQGLRSLVLWGPTDAPTAGRWMSAFRVMFQHLPYIRITIVLDRPLLLWSHPAPGHAGLLAHAVAYICAERVGLHGSALVPPAEDTHRRT
jgi:hypothetical protein